jgi:hypothetical protein
MRRCACGLLVAALVLGWTGSAAAVYPPPVKDEAKFFSADALEKANKKVKEIYDKYGQDVVIETFASVPADLKKKLEELEEKKKAKGRDEFFKGWAEARMKELGVRGVYVLVCKDPAYLYVLAHEETRKKAFTRKDADRLREKLLEKFRKKEFDAGLADGLALVEAALKANLGGK